MTAAPESDTSFSSLSTPHRLGVILVGAGNGTRLDAGIPKAFVQLGQQSLLHRVIETVVALPGPGHLVAVVPEDRAAQTLDLLEQATKASGATWGTNVARGGAERHLSVQNGLAVMPEWVDTVLVHDVARPLTPATLFTEVAHAVQTRGNGVIPVLPIVDTVKRVTSDGLVGETVDRSNLVRSQTPQGFPREALIAAYDRINDEYTDDAAVFQAAGFRVTTVAGSERALKLTTQHDLQLLEWMLTSGGDES